MEIDRRILKNLMQYEKIPCLAQCSVDSENTIRTDACDKGLGVALWQKQNGDDIKLIAVASRDLRNAVERYLIIGREKLGAVEL